MPLPSVYRDRDTADGGKAGRITTNPADVDAVVKRAWRQIYDGIGGCIEEAVERFLNKYCTYEAKFPLVEIKTIGAQMVFESFSKPKASAGALDSTDGCRKN